MHGYMVDASERGSVSIVLGVTPQQKKLTSQNVLLFCILVFYKVKVLISKDPRKV